MRTNHRNDIGPRELLNEISSDGSSLTYITRVLLERVASGIAQSTEDAPTLQYHPLGFFCIRWDLDDTRSVRIHIWDRRFDWQQDPNWPIHDHIFAFKSVVLHGMVQNKTYSIADTTSTQSKWTIYEVSYGVQKSRMTPLRNAIGLRISGGDRQPTGSMYELSAGVLHRSTLRSDQGITVLATKTDPARPNMPRVIGTGGHVELEFDRQPVNQENTLKIVEDAITWLAKDPCSASLHSFE